MQIVNSIVFVLIAASAVAWLFHNQGRGMGLVGLGILAFGLFVLSMKIRDFRMLRTDDAKDPEFTHFDADTVAHYEVPKGAEELTLPTPTAAAPVSHSAPEGVLAFTPPTPTADLDDEEEMAPPSFSVVVSPVSSPQAPAATPVQAGVAADISDSDKVLAWVGPCFRLGNAGRSSRMFAKETIGDGTNTLLFTDSMIICLMLGPDDIKGLGEDSIRGLIGKVIERASEDATEMASRFSLLYTAKWPEMVKALTDQSLPVSLENHLAFKVPYTNIERIELGDYHLTGVVKVHLHDGTTMEYSILSPKLIPGLKEALSGLVAVS